MDYINYIYIAIYILAVLGIAFWARKKESTEEFLIGGRKLGVAEISLSILAVFGGLEIVGQAALAYEIGFGAMWFWVGIAIGIFLLGLFSAKIKKLSSEEEFITISDYFFSKFDRKSGFLCALIIFVTFFALLIGQIIAGASLISPLLNISYIWAVLFIVLVTLAYLSLGGFKAVTKTDLLQGVITIIIFGVLLFSIDFKSYIPQGIEFSNLGGYGLFSFLFIGIFVIFAGADVWQRLYAAKNVKTIKKAFPISSVLIIVFGLVVTLVGIAAKTNFPNIKPEEALFYGFFQLLPPELFGLGIIIMLAAIMSAIDTQIFVLSSSISKDFIFRKKRISDLELKRYTTISFFIITIAATIVAIYISNIILILYGLFSLMLSVSPSVIGSFFFKLKSNAVFMSMLAGVVSLIVLVVIGKFNPENAVITLPSAIVFLIIGQIIFKKEKGVLKNEIHP